MRTFEFNNKRVENLKGVCLRANGRRNNLRQVCTDNFFKGWERNEAEAGEGSKDKTSSFNGRT